MPSVYDRRWDNAVRIAGLVNEAIESGSLVFDELGETVGPLVIDHDEKEILRTVGPRCFDCLFSGDMERDDGAHTSVKDYTSRFAKWSVADEPRPLLRQGQVK